MLQWRGKVKLRKSLSCDINVLRTGDIQVEAGENVALRHCGDGSVSFCRRFFTKE